MTQVSIPSTAIGPSVRNTKGTIHRPTGEQTDFVIWRGDCLAAYEDNYSHDFPGSLYPVAIDITHSKNDESATDTHDGLHTILNLEIDIRKSSLLGIPLYVYSDNDVSSNVA